MDSHQSMVRGPKRPGGILPTGATNGSRILSSIRAYGSSDLGLHYQGGGLQGQAGFFRSELLRCELTQLVLNQRQKLGGSVGFAKTDGVQELSNIVRHKRAALRDTRL